jgi:hypothetical protein
LAELADLKLQLTLINASYHTIGRYLALPPGTIRAGQNSPYFANYKRKGKYGPGKYNSIFAPLLFPNLFRQRLPSPISKQLRFCPQVHYIKKIPVLG